jgi:hypothetical protein
MWVPLSTTRLPRHRSFHPARLLRCCSCSCVWGVLALTCCALLSFSSRDPAGGALQACSIAEGSGDQRGDHEGASQHTLEHRHTLTRLHARRAAPNAHYDYYLHTARAPVRMLCACPELVTIPVVCCCTVAAIRDDDRAQAARSAVGLAGGLHSVRAHFVVALSFGRSLAPSLPPCLRPARFFRAPLSLLMCGCSRRSVKMRFACSHPRRACLAGTLCCATRCCTQTRAYRRRSSGSR